MAVGDSQNVRLEADEAYGPRYDQLVQIVARSDLPDDLSLAEGMVLQSKSPDGQPTRLTVAAVSEDTVTLDVNHPLAGQALSFEIELVAIS